MFNLSVHLCVCLIRVCVAQHSVNSLFCVLEIVNDVDMTGRVMKLLMIWRSRGFIIVYLEFATV